MIGAAIAIGSVAPQPWRNGGGMTRELLTWPAGDAWNARVSVADVTRDGPFSTLAGVVRWFAVVEGAGVELRFGDDARRVTRDDEPLRFDGAAAPMCRLLAGPTRDLNLMLRNASGAMTRAIDHRPWSPAGEACALFTAVDGVLHTGSERQRLNAFTLLVCTSPPPALRFAADGDPVHAAGWWLQWSGKR